ncbi:ABC transporter ATP-binding protein [Schleiferilactobacillus harbinensis]|uniref:ABC transporter ATP-binding protein n=1 Tax=Schleiferilactobacillus harbinensis TaxID=304207 RepID=UPI0039EB820A
MRLMLRYVLRYKRLLLGNFICVFGFIILELGLPTMLARMIDEGINTRRPDRIWFYGMVMVGVALIGLIGLIGLAYFASRITTNVVRDIRDDIFARTIRFSHEEHNAVGTASLITRTTNDAFQIMNFLQMILRTGFMTPLMIIASAFLIVRTSPRLAWMVFAGIPLLLLGVWLIAVLSKPLSEKQQGNLDSINGRMREQLSGIRVIRAFVREKFEQARFGEVNDAYANSSIKLFTLMAFAQPGFSMVLNVITGVIIWQGAVAIGQGQLAVGSLIAFIEYIFHVLFSFILFASVFMMYPRAAVSAGRIEELLNAKNEIEGKDGQASRGRGAAGVVFDHVDFAYPGNSEAAVLHDISFSAQPGQTVAFIGSTGSGKSTLIQLIPRLFDVSAGRILVTGTDVRDYAVKALRSKIGFVPQKAVLFTGTIADNLRYGAQEATDDDLWEALRIAQAADFVREQPDGLQSILTEGGTNLSGGQKQRLAIARAIVRRPDIYIFDDSFSALDYQTDAELRANLAQVTQQAIVFIVAQRVGTIRHADQIVVLDNGELVGMGTHEQLMATNPIYQEIARSQLSEEELA